MLFIKLLLNWLTTKLRGLLGGSFRAVRRIYISLILLTLILALALTLLALDIPDCPNPKGQLIPLTRQALRTFHGDFWDPAALFEDFVDLLSALYSSCDWPRLPEKLLAADSSEVKRVLLVFREALIEAALALTVFLRVLVGKQLWLPKELLLLLPCELGPKLFETYLLVWPTLVSNALGALVKLLCWEWFWPRLPDTGLWWPPYLLKFLEVALVNTAQVLLIIYLGLATLLCAWLRFVAWEMTVMLPDLLYAIASLLPPEYAEPVEVVADLYRSPEPMYWLYLIFALNATILQLLFLALWVIWLVQDFRQLLRWLRAKLAALMSYLRQRFFR